MKGSVVAGLVALLLALLIGLVLFIEVIFPNKGTGTLDFRIVSGEAAVTAIQFQLPEVLSKASVQVLGIEAAQET